MPINKMPIMNMPNIQCQLRKCQLSKFQFKKCQNDYANHKNAKYESAKQKSFASLRFLTFNDQNFINYIWLCPKDSMTRGLCYKTLYGPILYISVMSFSVCPWQAFPA